MPTELRLALFALLASLPATAMAQRTRIPFTRMRAFGTSIDAPGVAVIRTKDAWRRLWFYYGEDVGYAEKPGGGDSMRQGPRVDFHREMVIAVRFNQGNACGPRANYVREIIRTDSTLVVRIGLPEQRLRGVRAPRCDGDWNGDLDFVRVPRDDRRRIEFVGTSAGVRVPEPAPWWVQPSVESALDNTTPTAERTVSRRVLPRDPTTSRADLLRLAEHVRGYSDDDLGWGLLGNATVLIDPDILFAIATGLENRGPGLYAMRRLLDEFGLQLADNPTTSPEKLSFLVRKLGNYGERLLLARRLFQNAKVRASQRDLLYLSMHGDTTFMFEVCPYLLKHYSRSMDVRNADGTVGTLNSSCKE